MVDDMKPQGGSLDIWTLLQKKQSEKAELEVRLATINSEIAAISELVKCESLLGDFLVVSPTSGKQKPANGLRKQIDQLLETWPESEPITQRAIRRRLEAFFPALTTNALTASISSALSTRCKQGVLKVARSIPNPTRNAMRPAYVYEKILTA